MQKSVPLNKLLLSPRNVRKTKAADEDIAAMAASIRSKGLLQNLVVSESPTGKGFHEVDAGGCRLAALQLLAEQKHLPRNWPVPVLVVPRDDALEASLAENIRIPMNPADEVLAFAAIVEDYEGAGIVDRADRVANCARRFGVTVAHVEQRLRLAALAPEILAALREARITLDAAKAYAAYPDHKLQMKVFAAEEKKPESWRHSAQAIRDAMKGKVYRLSNPAVVYVGLDAYRAAGGRIQREMFMGAEDEEVLLDPSIVDKLCAERTAEDATSLAREDGWKDGVVKSWKGPSWQDATPPQGYKRSWGESREQLTEERKAECVLAYRIAPDGSTLEDCGYFFKPEEPAGSAASSPAYTPETPEQRAARERREEIEEKAVRLAAPKLAGTPLEGRTFWPNRYDDYVPTIDFDQEEAIFTVAILVKIPAADVESAMAEAERLYEAEQAELAEEDAAIAAEQAPVAVPEAAAGDTDQPAAESREPAEAAS